MKKILLAILVLVVGVAFTANSYATTSTSTLDVSLNAVVSCSVSTSPVIFDGYDGSVDVIGFGDVTVNCPLDVRYEIALDAGANFDGDYRNMSDGANTIWYGLGDPTGTYEWGDAEYAATYPFGSVVSDTGNGSAQPHTVIGGVAAGQAVSTDPYFDVVNVTVYY